MDTYERQERGDRGDYERYLSGMDSSMKQKVALTAAHLLAQGTVADMGMGSGSGSFALASLYPSLSVIGVDINPTMVALAAEKFGRPNLSFICGDIASRVFPDESLDGIFDSSVLHHVTTFTNYEYEAAARALENQARQLRPNGMLIVRDFVDPGDGEVSLDLPTGDGDAGDDPQNCSTASLFLRFAREFRKLATQPGFDFREEPSPRDGFRRFVLSRKLAAEFVLRKDYRRDWETEILEEYTYFTQQDFESCFARLGLRIVASTPIWNPWIVRNRLEGKVFFGDDGELPPTNYLIAGEKVAPGEGVRFEEGDAVAPRGFLSMEHHRHRQTGQIMDLVRRPHPTVDVVPWFVSDGELFVVARKSYPRAILASAESVTAPALDGSTPAHYVTEPLTVLQRDDPFGRTVVESLAQRAAIRPEQIRGFHEGSIYYPSPGGVEEEVRSALVEVDPTFEQRRIENVSGFATSGHVRAIEATQLLRAAQVGGMTDARLEINVYALLRRLGRSAGPWIGDAIALQDGPVQASRLDALLSIAPRRMFDTVDGTASFLELRCADFRESGADGTVLASQPLEYVLPRTRSINTIAVALLSRQDGEVCIGLDDDDLPAAQSFTGNSNIIVTPAWRLPVAARTRRAARDWVDQRLRHEYGVRAANWFELGGRYHPSPGVTPERVYPFAIEAVSERTGERKLTWVPLAEVIACAAQLRDGHLRIVAFRAAHALGLV